LVCDPCHFVTEFVNEIKIARLFAAIADGCSPSSRTPRECRECGYASVEEYVRQGLELDPEQVSWAIEGLKRMQPDEPIPYSRAIELGTSLARRP
jgi:hypothetical protein